ncbi:MAG: C4-dicarboxylate ABC transporter [Phycisphaerae bacterium]|nr:C4-dicarboxylate ABC transporter [Phycisphaerae bacterium]NIR25686.1 C4-dicarboxylate ABC transporter [Gammaproteobacteria bacterium]NIV00477.1 C4-dicarboxylate ABC transporter [Phycisphaerae bacterium]NIX31707.1 C4-dicarboxylate ABC transporter [Phycisphaerae bacterium]
MKKNVVRIAAVLSVVVLMTAGIVEARTWKVSHVRPQGTAIDKDLHWFADNLKDVSGGDMKVKVYPASALGDYTVVQERIGLGAVDMACQPPASAADKRFQIAYFPFMVKGWDQARKNYSAGAPLRNAIEGLYEKQGIQVLAAWPVYFGGVALNKKPNEPSNPDVSKGVKLRVPPMKTFQLLAKNLGYMGAPLPFSEAFTAVQTGVVDGVIGSGAEGYYASFRDVTKYYVPTNSHFETWYLLINKELYDDLDAAQKEKLNKVAQEFEDRRWKSAEADQAANEQRLADYGAEILRLSDDQIARAAEKAQKNIWPEILDDVGREWGEKVLGQIVD